MMGNNHTSDRSVGSGDGNSNEKRPVGLYIHIPFCQQKCIYCDFVSIPGCSREKINEYFLALETEIGALVHFLKKSRGEDFAFDTVFIGGGTPSLIRTQLLADVLETVPVKPFAEVTMESNPGSVTYEKLKTAADAGVNRISLGVQSFNDRELRFLGRVHDKAAAVRAFEDIRRAGIDNINCDLIFGFPGQTEESWDVSLRSAIACGVEHLSFYSLQIEDGTPLYGMVRTGTVDQPDTETDRRMYAQAVDILRDNGLMRYEISNASKPGRECRHNLLYWSMEEYAGVGAAAHSFLNGCRYSDPEDVDTYISWIRERISLEGEDDYERLHEMLPSSQEELITDCIFTALRKVRGLDLGRFRDLFGMDLMDHLGGRVKPFLMDGSLILEDSCLRFSDKGIDISNYIIGELL